MKETDFEKIWQQEIWPFLQKRKGERKNTRDTMMLSLLLILGFGMSFALLGDEFELTWLSLPFFALGVFAAWKLYTTPNFQYNREFKRKMFFALNKLTDFTWDIDLGDKYSKAEKKSAWRYILFEQQHSLFGKRDVPQSEKTGAVNYFMRHDGRKVFEESGLYTNYTSLGCHDKLTSRWQHSEVEAYETKVERSMGRSSITVFRGFIIKASIDKEFRGETFVQTESDSGAVAGENSWPSFGGAAGVEETELEWIDFEKFLRVKASDPAEAREIFTPDFMEVMYEWWQGHEEPLRMAFKNQAVYIAYPTTADLEPRIFGQLEVEKGAVRDTLELLVFVENIIKTLLGGKRLWFDKPLAPQPPSDYE